jgi:hypothetical protein
MSIFKDGELNSPEDGECDYEWFSKYLYARDVLRKDPDKESPEGQEPSDGNLLNDGNAISSADGLELRPHTESEMSWIKFWRGTSVSHSDTVCEPCEVFNDTKSTTASISRRCKYAVSY